MGEQANYQGEALGLRLNGEAAHALHEVLERLHWSRDRGTSDSIPLRLPDGRTLTLSVTLTRDGDVLDENGEYLGDDGIAHGDVTGDLRAHADATEVIEAASWLSFMDLDRDVLSGERPLDVEEVAGRRADAALKRVGWRHETRPGWAAEVKERALAAARERLPGELTRMREIHERVQADRQARDSEPPSLAM